MIVLGEKWGGQQYYDTTIFIKLNPLTGPKFEALPSKIEEAFCRASVLLISASKHQGECSRAISRTINSLEFRRVLFYIIVARYAY